jgi:hypothetical protein
MTKPIYYFETYDKTTGAKYIAVSGFERTLECQKAEDFCRHSKESLLGRIERAVLPIITFGHLSNVTIQCGKKSNSYLVYTSSLNKLVRDANQQRPGSVTEEGSYFSGRKIRLAHHENQEKSFFDSLMARFKSFFPDSYTKVSTSLELKLL